VGVRPPSFITKQKNPLDVITLVGRLRRTTFRNGGFSYGRICLMTKQATYTFPDTDSNNDPFETWEDAEDLCDFEEMDDEFED
jgi:hypothetical protein